MNGVVARLDDYGRPAWIAAMIAGFVLFWPIGLIILAYMIGSGRMSCGQFGAWGEHRQERWQRKMERMQAKMERWNAFRQQRWGAGAGFTPTGNRAFDEYRSETIRRLEDEANEFGDFLERLRHAKDKAEFDQFMADRRDRRDAPPTTGEQDRNTTGASN
jgi:hypothetical protein